LRSPPGAVVERRAAQPTRPVKVPATVQRPVVPTASNVNLLASGRPLLPSTIVDALVDAHETPALGGGEVHPFLSWLTTAQRSRGRVDVDRHWERTGGLTGANVLAKAGHRCCCSSITISLADSPLVHAQGAAYFRHLIARFPVGMIKSCRNTGRKKSRTRIVQSAYPLCESKMDVGRHSPGKTIRACLSNNLGWASAR